MEGLEAGAGCGRAVAHRGWESLVAWLSLDVRTRVLIGHLLGVATLRLTARRSLNALRRCRHAYVHRFGWRVSSLQLWETYFFLPGVTLKTSAGWNQTMFLNRAAVRPERGGKWAATVPVREHNQHVFVCWKPVLHFPRCLSKHTKIPKHTLLIH